MPLSEQEQKMLDEMERQLFADDPRLARAFRPRHTPRRDGRRILLGLGGVVLGLIALVAGVALSAVWLGVLAFIAMVVSAIYAVTAPVQDGTSSDQQGHPSRGQRGGRQNSGFVKRMEDRWEKRSGGNDPRL